MRRFLHAPVLPALLLLIILSGISYPAWAHAVLMESTPKANSAVKGPDVSITLRFNVRVDGSRSRLRLLMPDGSSRSINIAKQPAPDILEAQADGLKPATYKLLWQVLASDGHISSGQVPFTVQ